MAAKKSNEAKVVAWTDTMKVDFNGTISACAIQLFMYITTQAVREKAFVAIQRHHEMLKAKGQ